MHFKLRFRRDSSAGDYNKELDCTRTWILGCLRPIFFTKLELMLVIVADFSFNFRDLNSINLESLPLPKCYCRNEAEKSEASSSGHLE